MKKRIEILATVGPTSLNKDILKYLNSKIDILRINLSHVLPDELSEYISYLIKNTKLKICIDTEGAQIRTKVPKKVKLKKNSLFTFRKNKPPYLYPSEVFEKIKKNDLLSIGFDDLKAKVIKKSRNNFLIKVLNSGLLESNKGVVVINRSVKLNYLTKNDLKSIEIAKKFNIKCFALSFTNDHHDVIKFKKILPNCRRIFKIESKKGLKNFKKIIQSGDEFLIDRGDLSKDVKIENIPLVQRKIIALGKKKKKNVYVATNFLESMIINSYPTRAEVNDIYNTIEMGSKGLVLAAETAVGKNPHNCVKILKKIIKAFKEKSKSKW